MAVHAAGRPVGLWQSPSRDYSDGSMWMNRDYNLAGDGSMMSVGSSQTGSRTLVSPPLGSALGFSHSGSQPYGGSMMVSSQGNGFSFPSLFEPTWMNQSTNVQSQSELEKSLLEGKAGQAWLTPDVVERRARDSGLRHPEVLEFINSCEFISLGSFCGPTRALQSLGLKRFSYPFDWVRTDVPSTIRCLQTDFDDFLTYSIVMDGPSQGTKLYGGTKWGGSFWHHDPNDPKVAANFERRICRLQGRSEVAETVSRVFCVALNSLSDLASIPTLKDLLDEMLPDASVYLVVLIDNQRCRATARIYGCDDIMFFSIGDDMFNENQDNWSEQAQAEAYAQGISMAVRAWAGVEDFNKFPAKRSIAELHNACMNFEGGNPSERLYWPVRMPNQVPPLVGSARGRGKEYTNKLLDWFLELFEPLVSPCGTGEDEDDWDDAMKSSPQRRVSVPRQVVVR